MALPFVAIFAAVVPLVAIPPFLVLVLVFKVMLKVVPSSSIAVPALSTAVPAVCAVSAVAATRWAVVFAVLLVAFCAQNLPVVLIDRLVEVDRLHM